MNQKSTRWKVCSAVVSGALIFCLISGFFGYKVLNSRWQRSEGQLLQAQELLARAESENAALQQALEEAQQKARVPSVFFGRDTKITALQGEILKVTMDSAGLEGTPQLQTDLGPAHFVPEADGLWTAYVPVGFAQTPGDYEIWASLEDTRLSLQVTVMAKEYGEQHMTMSSATNESTRGAEGASEEYAEKIKVLYDTYEDEILWDGLFVQPVEGRISTQFGIYRYTTYTDGGSRTTRHTGIDIASPAGTPVPAAGSGRVVFAGELMITGNTVVIEHGAGLKTYYFHMSEIDCTAGDLVSKGDLIGKVGSTGYSTGPHLHFEVMLGEYSLNPWSLFDGTSRIYQ